MEQPDFPYIFLSYSQIEFDLAEAAARGFNVGGTAAEHYPLLSKPLLIIGDAGCRSYSLFGSTICGFRYSSGKL